MKLSDTKFDIKQNVFYMEDNKVKTGQVVGIGITINHEGEARTEYWVMPEDFTLKYVRGNGSCFYATKKELLAAL